MCSSWTMSTRLRSTLIVHEAKTACYSQPHNANTSNPKPNSLNPKLFNTIKRGDEAKKRGTNEFEIRINLYITSPAHHRYSDVPHSRPPERDRALISSPFCQGEDIGVGKIFLNV